MTRSLEKLIFLEARLLDEGKLDDWLALYSEEGTYWVPIDENADPLKDASIIYDSHQRLQMRVHQLVREGRVAQSPPSRSMRMITNLDMEETSPLEATAHWNLLLLETRAGDWRQRALGETRQFPARCEATFRKSGDAWKFLHKKIVLLNRSQPIEGLSFII